jgi:1-deoxy-D-xylulose-5-phosphate reductoisomerase
MAAVLFPETLLKKPVLMPKRGLSIFGSTGSIGLSALSVVDQHRDLFDIRALVARGSNYKDFSAQILKYKPRYAALADPDKIPLLKGELSGSLRGTRIGELEEVVDLIACDEGTDIALAATVGMAGLIPVLACLEKGKTVALANKESLVAGGDLIRALLKEKGGAIIPVDSEHSALFQVLQGEVISDVSKIILTASGGPFWRWQASEFASITPAQAVQHPNWSMGTKISIDSATLMNKALELIEAAFLFDCDPDLIDVTIHPESIVHSLLEFKDGSQLAQLSCPDMKGAIAYALSFPYKRLPGIMNSLDLRRIGSLHFYDVDHDKFPALRLARKTLRLRGLAPAVFNIANEVAVELFREEKIRFNEIVSLVEKAVEKFTVENSVKDVNQLFALETRVRDSLREEIN